MSVIIINILKGIADIFFKYWKPILIFMLVICAVIALIFLKNKVEKQSIKIQSLEKTVSDYEEIAKQNQRDIEVIKNTYAKFQEIDRKKEITLNENEKIMLEVKQNIDKTCDFTFLDPVWDRVNELYYLATETAN